MRNRQCAEDTEALKHEFLFRFFKAWFYDLDQVAPARLHKACDARNCVADTVGYKEPVCSGSNGEEQLIATGCRRIDSAVAPFVDSLLNHVVIIEGYSTAGTPDQQFVTSRRRAALVRQYLEAHFHLIHSNVGIVPLRNKPPQGAGRSNPAKVAGGSLPRNAQPEGRVRPARSAACVADGFRPGRLA
jgi:hypothetical protein